MSVPGAAGTDEKAVDVLALVRSGHAKTIHSILSALPDSTLDWVALSITDRQFRRHWQNPKKATTIGGQVEIVTPSGGHGQKKKGGSGTLVGYDDAEMVFLVAVAGEKDPRRAVTVRPK